MAEPDHIFVKPLPNIAYGSHAAGYPFFYIRPAQNEKVIRKFYPKENGPVTDVDPIGNSPVIIQKVKFHLIIACIRCLINFSWYTMTLIVVTVTSFSYMLHSLPLRIWFFCIISLCWRI